jgi:hypothetical protein
VAAFSPAESVGSNLTGGMDVCLLCVCYYVERSLQQADHSSRGVLPTVVRRVWSRNLVYEEALAYCEAVAPKTNKIHFLPYREHHLVPLLKPMG